MNAFEKFKDAKLPSKDDYYSKLSEEHISNEDYERAKKYSIILISKLWVITTIYI